MLRTAQAMCLVMMALCLQSGSCEKDEDEEGNPYYTQYVDINVTRCERVGSVLMIDFTVTNKDKNALDVILAYVSASDNAGGYYTDASGVVSIAFADNGYYWRADCNISSKSSVTGHMKIRNFNPDNKATNVTMKMPVEIGGRKLADKAFEKKIDITDNRVMEHGVQTNDTKLAWKATANWINDSDVDLHFTVTNNTGQRLENFGMGYAYGGEAQCQDNLGNKYGSSICFDDNNWYHLAQTDNFSAGSSINGTIRIKDVKSGATEMTVNVGATAGNYIVEDETLRFITIPIGQLIEQSKAASARD